jgi:hypothetical protein
MKKIIIGLLIIAAGTAVFFLLRNKKNITATNGFPKEWILGKWKPNEVNDSNLSKFQFDFQKNGNVIRSLNDTAKADTSHYEWSKANELVWKNNASDSTAKVFKVTKLTNDSLQIMSVDSSTILFFKMK